MSPAHDTLAATCCLQSPSRISFWCYLPRPGFCRRVRERGEGEGRLNGKPLPSARGLASPSFPPADLQKGGLSRKEKVKDFNPTAHPHTRIVGLTRPKILCFSCNHPVSRPRPPIWCQCLPILLSDGCNHWQLGALPLALPPTPFSLALLRWCESICGCGCARLRFRP